MDLVRKSVSLNFSAWFGRFPIIEKSVAFPGDRGVIRKGCHGPQDKKRKYKLKWKQCQNFPIPIEMSCGVSQVPAGHEGGFEDQVGWWVRSGFIWCWKRFLLEEFGEVGPNQFTLYFTNNQKRLSLYFGCYWHGQNKS